MQRWCDMSLILMPLAVVGGIGVVGEDVAAADLDGIDAQRGRGARSTRCSPTALPIGWPTARYCEDGGLF